ncbi:hypothetical protein LPYR103PRE_10700 [Segatella asaccharophila]
MIPVQTLTREKETRNDGKNRKADHLLHHLQLYQRKGPAIINKAYAIGRYLKAIFEKRY